jgi:hypothetical protein
MANLQVKNIPDSLHQRLRHYAQQQQCTLSEIVLGAIERELARHEWRERLLQRPLTDLGVTAASLLEEERQNRSENLGCLLCARRLGSRRISTPEPHRPSDCGPR